MEPPKRAPKRRRRRKHDAVKDNDAGDISDAADPPKPPTKSRRRSNPIDYADHNAAKPSTQTRRFNGTLVAVSRPSYCLKRSVGTTLKSKGGSFSVECCRRLRVLLKKLIRRHNWGEASGVLSSLLLATSDDKSASHNRFKYWAAMEILKQINGDNGKFFDKIQHVYDLWTVKSGMGGRRRRVKVAIQLEYALFCLTHGGLHDAYQNAKGLMQDRNFESDPMSNFVVGLTSYEMWYSTLEEKWQLKNLNLTGGSMQSELHEAQADYEYGAFESQEINSSMEVNSVTSVANDKENTDIDSSEERVPMDVVDNLQTQSPQQTVSVANDKENTDLDSPEERVPMDVVDNLQTQSPQQTVSVANDKENTDLDSPEERVPMDVVDNLQTQSSQQTVSHADSYVYSAEGSQDIRSSSPAHYGGLSVSIFQAPGLPPWLLPIKIPPTNDIQDDVIYEHRDLENDYYRNAVKHLQAALHSTPPVAEALHPLIQVLLSGDHVNEALHELDNFCEDSATAHKLRLKVGLLEHFDRGNHLKLSSCYEEILEIDPTCNNSLVKLINMHRRGDYGTEKLVNMLGLFLDATYAEFNIWKDLASSLIKLSESVGDQMSICSNGNGEEIKRSYTGHSNQIPEMFTHGQSGKTWRFRCRWWLTRHFSSRILASEIASGVFQLLTYKAAVAAFLYGPGFKYVTKATEILENDSTNHDLNSVLRIHVQNYVGIYKV